MGAVAPRAERAHLDALGLEGLHVRGGHCRVARRREDPVDLLVLLGRHAPDVVVERDELARLGARRLEAQQLGDLVLVLEVGVHALLDEVAKLGVEGEVRLLVELRALLREGKARRG